MEKLVLYRMILLLGVNMFEKRQNAFQLNSSTDANRFPIV